MASFDIYYKLAKNYYAHYGNLNVPRDFKTLDGINYDENGYGLGLWVFNQRLYYKRHPEKVERIELLIGVGMEFDLAKENFERMYLLACKYYAYYGHLEVPAKFRTKDGINYDKDGYPLGHFITNQRYSYNYDEEYSMDKYMMLNDIAMNWSVKNK